MQLTAELRLIKISRFDIFFHLSNIYFVNFLFSYLNKNYGFYLFSFFYFTFTKVLKTFSNEVSDIKIENDFLENSFKSLSLWNANLSCIYSIHSFGADITVDSAISISQALNIDSFIGLTIIALVQLEIATSITAAKKEIKHDYWKYLVQTFTIFFNNRFVSLLKISHITKYFIRRRYISCYYCYFFFIIDFKTY